MEKVIHRFVAGVRCGCGKKNELLLPEVECGTEMIWYLRCGGCGGFGWFHAGQERAFRNAIRDAAERRGEPGGLSEKGTREAHESFAESLPECGCGGRFHVVRLMEEEPCLQCGNSLVRPGVAGKSRVPVPRIFPTPSR